METGTLIGNKAYYITYYAEEGKFDDYMPQIRQIVDSIYIGNDAVVTGSPTASPSSLDNSTNSPNQQSKALDTDEESRNGIGSNTTSATVPATAASTLNSNTDPEASALFCEGMKGKVIGVNRCDIPNVGLNTIEVFDNGSVTITADPGTKG